MSVKPDVWAQKEPPDEMVWEVCPYLRDLEPCRGCPRWEDRGDGRPVMRACFALASEVCRIVFALDQPHRENDERPEEQPREAG